MPHWDLEVDVVCVGSGLASVTAALVAHDAGRTVVILEKAPKLGGICAYSGGEVFVPGNHKMAAEGQPDDPDAALAYLRFLAGGYADATLQHTLLRTGPEAARWLEEQAGVRWQIIRHVPDYHYPYAPGTVAQGRYLEVELFAGQLLGAWQEHTYLTPHLPLGVTNNELFAWGGLASIPQWDFQLMATRVAQDLRGCGPGMMGYFLKAALIDRGIRACVHTPVRALVCEDGRVVGVRAERQGQAWHVRARYGVVLGIGGYDWRADFARFFEGLPEWHSAVLPAVEGDNLLLGGEVGAALAGVPPYNLAVFFGYHIPGEEHDGRPLYRPSWEGGYPHALWVNQAGQRFCDESFYREYLPKCHAWDGLRQQHPNYPVYLIFDGNFRKKYAFGAFLPGMDIPTPWLARAETPRALAVQLGIDPDGLVTTIERFNRFADGPEDPDFGRGRYPWATMMIGDRRRPNPNLGPLDTPPFYGIRLVPVGIGVNAVGLQTNQYAQVMHVRGHAIPGLYAAGNSAAALDIGAGYQSGLANLRGMTWGYIAGGHAAVQAL